MKGSSMNTHMGNITIDKEVIAQYAGTVATECFGIVGMGIKKRYYPLLGRRYKRE